MSKQILSEEFKRMQKLAGLITENVNTKMKIFDLKDQNGNSTELFKIENFTNTDEVIDTLNKHLNTDELHTEDTGTGYNYAYVAGDGDVKFVKSLDEFDEGFKTEEEWGVASAEEITQENDDYPVELGEPHPSAVYPAGGAYHKLSTGESVDIGEDPYHRLYPLLTIKEHEEVIELLNNYIEQYETNFGGTKYYNKGVVELAKYIVKQHQKKILSLQK
jgi:hypothetical protein